MTTAAPRIGLIYHQVFTPQELNTLADFQTKREVSETQLRIASDHDGERERIFRLPIMVPGPSPADDLTIELRLGNCLMPNKRDPLYVLVSDGDSKAVGFKISESGPIKGAEGVPERFFDLTRLSGDDKETASLNPHDYPDEFHITFKPSQYWGTIFCAQGNGTKQCVGYGKKPDFTKGVYVDLYRDQPVEEYIINYLEVIIYRNGRVV